jgi:hypothetical protein
VAHSGRGSYSKDVRPVAMLGCSVLGALLTGCGTSPEYVNDVEQEVVYESGEGAPSMPKASWLGGWTGMGSQSSGSSWNMRLELTSTSPGQCARVSYPSVGCSGYWECAAGFDGSQLQAMEYITEGKDRCIDQVEVVLVANPDGRTVSFHGIAEDITAEASLGRSQ